MPLYLIKFKPYTTVGNKKEFMSELEEHGGLFVKENRLRKGYIYDVPDEALNTNAFKTRDFIQSSERQAGD
ncbi:hypothetical protein NUU61_006063 [Penicillium alfredii]|uniref:Uncharacterized protein n=1 Tax=Penicillium alfredii TaxID=1506179 RepID=A0A9W9F058_9EURO|nr:uncharacterized protein NUU61_006063 [Penicillium alfredii]KAJ5091193.1 hypothetical protein NUU61_006063 [Penicillium alfredii]